jgi:hypothetical protein
MEAYVLASAQVLPDRPFTHPRHGVEDGQVLRYLAAALYETMGRPDSYRGRSVPVVHFYRERDGRYHRQVLVRPEALREPRPLAVVGFFGQRRPEADSRPIEAMDEAMLPELAEQEGLLAYCTLALAAGAVRHHLVDFGNLVVFAGPEAKAQWRASERHRYAATCLAPAYYASVRIYNGVLPRGLVDPGSLELQVVKYFDYRETPPWRGLRTLG